MFALFNDGRYYSNHFTWKEVIDNDFSETMQFCSEEGAQKFLQVS